MRLDLCDREDGAIAVELAEQQATHQQEREEATREDYGQQPTYHSMRGCLLAYRDVYEPKTERTTGVASDDYWRKKALEMEKRVECAWACEAAAWSCSAFWEREAENRSIEASYRLAEAEKSKSEAERRAIEAESRLSKLETQFRESLEREVELMKRVARAEKLHEVDAIRQADDVVMDAAQAQLRAGKWAEERSADAVRSLGGDLAWERLVHPAAAQKNETTNWFPQNHNFPLRTKLDDAFEAMVRANGLPTVIDSATMQMNALVAQLEKLTLEHDTANELTQPNAFDAHIRTIHEIVFGNGQQPLDVDAIRRKERQIFKEETERFDADVAAFKRAMAERK